MGGRTQRTATPGFLSAPEGSGSGSTVDYVHYQQGRDDWAGQFVAPLSITVPVMEVDAKVREEAIEREAHP